VDGVNLDEMREFAKQFKIRRLSLGLTQTQVGQALSVTEGPSYSQSAICRSLAVMCSSYLATYSPGLCVFFTTIHLLFMLPPVLLEVLCLSVVYS